MQLKKNYMIFNIEIQHYQINFIIIKFNSDIQNMQYYCYMSKIMQTKYLI